MAAAAAAAAAASPAADAAADAALGATATTLAAMMLAEACGLAHVPLADALGFHDHGTHVVVVTNDGRKVSTAD